MRACPRRFPRRPPSPAARMLQAEADREAQFQEDAAGLLGLDFDDPQPDADEDPKFDDRKEAL